MPLTKVSYSMISGAPANVFDFMTDAEIADVIAGTASVNVTSAIQAAINSDNPIIIFPAGTYLCDPVVIGSNANNKTLIGFASSNNAYSPDQKQTRILASQSNSSFWVLSSVFRLTVENIIFDGNGKSDLVYQLQQTCSRHTYQNCYFMNSTPGTGTNLMLGDSAINIQVDLNCFYNCKSEQSGFAEASRLVQILQTNTILNSFYNCGFRNGKIHVYISGSSQNLFDKIDHGVYSEYAYLIQGSGISKISDCYTESTTGISFYREISIAYTQSRQPCIIERNKLQGVANSIQILPTQRHVIRDNLIVAANISISAPSNPAQAYASVIENNTFGTFGQIIDNSGISIQSNNYSNGVLLNDKKQIGLWTPSLLPASGSFLAITYNANTKGEYQRIGNVVYISAYIETDSITVGTATGNVNVGGLPFASLFTSALSVGDVSGWSTNSPSAIRTNGGSINARLLYRTSANAATSRLQVSNLSTGSGGNIIYISGSYLAN